MSRFTIEYSQPAEYRFSLDSVEAPRAIAAWVDSPEGIPVFPGDRELRILDLCAGSGVMGLELAFHLSRPLHIDFIEVQAVYREHFEINLRRLQDVKTARGEKLTAAWVEMNYENLARDFFRDSYDLIVANPPYFVPEQGSPSPSDFKNRCRFFLDSTPEKLWDVTLHALRPGASAFLLLRPLDAHGLDLFAELERRLRYQARVEKWQDVRGTHLARITKQK